MKRFSAVLFALFAVATVGCSVVAASASAAKVPGFLLLPEETSILTFESTPKDEIKGGVEQNKVKSELQNTAGKLTGEGVLLKLTLNSGSDDEGTFEALFLLVVNKKGEACATENEKAAGEVLLAGKARMVHDINATSGNGVLFEPNEVVITCGAEKIHVKGTSLSLVKGTGTKEGEDFKKWLGDLLCKNATGEKIGEPLDENFWGLAGTEEKALLLSNFGTGFKKSCELIFSEVELNSNKMAELMEVG